MSDNSDPAATQAAPRYLRVARHIWDWTPPALFFIIFGLVLLLLGVDPAVVPPCG